MHNSPWKPRRNSTSSAFPIKGQPQLPRGSHKLDFFFFQAWLEEVASPLLRGGSEMGTLSQGGSRIKGPRQVPQAGPPPSTAATPGTGTSAADLRESKRREQNRGRFM